MLHFIEFRCWVLTKCQTCCKFCSSLKVHLIYTTTSRCSHYFHSDKSENQGPEMLSNLPKVIHLAYGKARIWGLAPEPFLLICPKKKALVGRLTYNFLPLFLASRLIWENVSFICSFIWNPIYLPIHSFSKYLLRVHARSAQGNSRWTGSLFLWHMRSSLIFPYSPC